MTRADLGAEEATINGRGPQVTSDAQARLREEDAVTGAPTVEAADEGTVRRPEDGAPAAAASDVPADRPSEVRVRPAEAPGSRERRAELDDADVRAVRRGPSVPVVPILAVLLVLLLAGAGYLWFTRPAPSSVRTADYVQVLQAARSEVVDLTSFDYETLDDDIAQAKKISVNDLQTESVKQLNDNRSQLTAQQAVVNTQVVGAAVTRADATHGTVLMVIQSTQKTKAAAQPQVVRYRIEAQLEKTGGRWKLSGISGK